MVAVIVGVKVDMAVLVYVAVGATTVFVGVNKLVAVPVGTVVLVGVMVGINVAVGGTTVFVAVDVAEITVVVPPPNSSKIAFPALMNHKPM